MRTVQLMSVVLFAVVATGCDETILSCSVHPLCSDDVLAAEPSLEGTWTQQWTYDCAFGKQTPRERITVTLEKQAHATYAFVYKEGENRLSGVARLVRLGEQLYLDVEAHDLSGPLRQVLDSWCEGPILKRGLHWPWRIVVKGDSLGVAALRPDWHARVAKYGGSFQEIVLKDDVKAKALAGSTRQLQELFRKHGDDLFDTTHSAALYRRQSAANED